jgi:hypothetical protein
MVALNCPNLSEENRMYLILNALERAKEQGVSIKYNDFIRRVVNQSSALCHKWCVEYLE